MRIAGTDHPKFKGVEALGFLKFKAPHQSLADIASVRLARQVRGNAHLHDFEFRPLVVGGQGGVRIRGPFDLRVFHQRFVAHAQLRIGGIEGIPGKIELAEHPTVGPIGVVRNG